MKTSELESLREQFDAFGKAATDLRIIAHEVVAKIDEILSPRGDNQAPAESAKELWIWASAKGLEPQEWKAIAQGLSLDSTDNLTDKQLSQFTRAVENFLNADGDVNGHEFAEGE